MKYILTLLLSMVLSALVIAAAIAEGGDEVAQPFFLGAIVFVVLIFVGIGSVYFGKKSGNDRPWHFAIASFVPISWLGWGYYRVATQIRKSGWRRNGKTDARKPHA